ncbi:hypothetical protein [Candidatus Binatus sp.]|uniref:hypothetical protein n=1 Tax=Candidatus Binatus sp. TaxID=2811406 RepID=UPI003CC5931D
MTAKPQSPNQTPNPSNSGHNSESDSTGALIFLTAVMAAATIAIAVFNYQLVGVTDEMRKATNAAAAAADAALHVNRPAIVVTGIVSQVGIHQRTGTPNTLVGYTPQIYNLGSGPAEIIQVFSHSRLFEAYETRDGIPNLAAEEPTVNDLLWDAESDRREFPRTILGAGESFENYMAGYTPIVNWIGPDDIEKVELGEKLRAVYGLIRYRSSVKKYWTRFFYWYDPQRRSFRRAYRPELNRRT